MDEPEETREAPEDPSGTPSEAGTSEDPIETAWKAVESGWDDAATHKRFLTLCISLGRLPEAGRRYREVRDTDPDRRDEAVRHIDEILTLAMQTMQATRTPPPPSRRPQLFFVALGATLAMIAFALWAFFSTR